MSRSTQSKSGAGHITVGDVLDDLGFSRSEASALMIKASILDAILAEVDRRALTQRQLADILDEYQPNVSNLMRGRISRVSIEKLLAYADRLNLRSSIELLPQRRTGRALPARRIPAKEKLYA